MASTGRPAVDAAVARHAGRAGPGPAPDPTPPGRPPGPAGALIAVITGRRSAYLVLIVWVLVLGVLGSHAGKLSGAEKNQASSWLPASAESTRALDAQSAFESPNVLTAVVVYERPGGLTAADRSKMAADAATFRTLAPLGAAPSGPTFSADGAAAEVIVPYDLGPDNWQRSSGVVAHLNDVARGDPGLQVHVTGPAGYAAASSNAFKGIDSTLLYAAIAVVVTILLFTYRSPVLWAFPVIGSAAALATAEGLVYLLAVHAGLTVNAQSAGILTVLVFGAGTDYALLLVARYREELRRHADRHEAMAVALRRAAPALLASAGTVTVGMLCLLLAETNSTKSLGPVVAVGIVVALLAMTTLLPALLVSVGRWVFWPVRPRYGSADPTATGVWATVAARLRRRPRQVWVITAVTLGILALGLLQLRASGLTNAQSYTGRPAAVVGEQAVARHFPGGAGSPVVVIADAAAAGEVRAAIAATPGIAAVSPPVSGDGKVYLQATLDSPPDSTAAYDTIDHLRATLHAIPGADALVGGNSAVQLDVERAAAHDRNLIIPVILLVVLGILAALLRAVVAPVVLIATVVLSLFAALGASAFIFRHVFGYAGADTSMPLYAFVFLVALGIDYNIFLMTRVREETLRLGNTRAGAVAGLTATGGVITSAGLVLAGTFAVLATLPFVTFVEIGFTVAFGVLLDTIVVRSVLVTAITLDLGDRMWWPSRLAQPQRPSGADRALAPAHP